MDSPDKDRAIAAIIARLERQFPGLPQREVVDVILEAHDAFHDYPISTHVPVIVERQAKDRLRGREAEQFHP